MLAGKSLQAIDDDFVLDISHLGVVLGLMQEYGIENKDEILAYISSKNVHDLNDYCNQKGIAKEFCDKISLLLGAKGCFCEVLEVAKQVATNELSKQAVAELQVICDSFETMGFANKIRLDFSIINDNIFILFFLNIFYASKARILL